MISNPQLQQLHDRLRRHGFTVVPFHDALEVRTSMLLRIRVSIQDGALQVTQRFGGVSPGVAALLSVVGLGALAYTTVVRTGVTPFSIGLSFLSVLAATWECLRFTVVEAQTTRIHMVWAGIMQEEGRDAAALGAGAMHPLDATRDRAAAPVNR